MLHPLPGLKNLIKREDRLAGPLFLWLVRYYTYEWQNDTKRPAHCAFCRARYTYPIFPAFPVMRIPVPRRGRRSRRLVARSFHASGRDISRSGATSFCLRRQKDAKTPPKTHGLWNSFTPNVIRRKKAHKESPPLLSPLPLPRTARRRAGLLSCSGIVASISAVSRIPAHPDRRTP